MIRLALGSSDAIDPPPARSMTCLARITRGDGATGWCTLDDGHYPGTQHEGVLSVPIVGDTYGPRSKR